MEFWLVPDGSTRLISSFHSSDAVHTLVELSGNLGVLLGVETGRLGLVIIYFGWLIFE